MTMEKQSFIALPLPPSPSSSLSSGGGGGGGGSMKRQKNLKFILFSIFMAIFCVVISFVLIWNIIQTNELNKEVESLRKGLANLKEKIGYDLLAELEKFEVEYRTLEKHRKPLEATEKIRPIPNPVIIRAEDDIKYDDNQFFDIDDDDIEDDDSNYDVDDDDDDGDDDNDDDYEEYITDDDIDDDTKNQDDGEVGESISDLYETILHESGVDGKIAPKKRISRSIAYTNQGVPILEDSYLRAKRRNTTKHKEIPDEWFKHKTVTTPYIRNNKKKLLYDWSVKQEGTTNTKRSYNTNAHNIQLMKDRQERHNQFYLSRLNRMNHNDRLLHDRNLIGDTIKPSDHADYETTTTATVGTTSRDRIYNRASRVMPTNEDKTKAFRQVMTKREYAKLKRSQQKNNFPMEHVQAEPHVVYPTKSLPNPRQRRSATLTQTSAGNRQRTFGIHYVGQATNYDPQHHSHYDENGRVLHNGARYRDWKLSKWSSDSRMHEFFPISNGIVTIREPGLYFIYAQIFYHNVHDTNGFTIHLNESGNKLMQCTTMTTSNQDKTNTCYTASAHYLDANDKLYVEDLSGGHYTIFEPSRSFFGLFKIGDIRMFSSAPR